MNAITKHDLLKGDDVSVLDACPLTAGFTKDERKSLAGLLEIATFERGECLIEQAATDQLLWIVISGACTIVREGCGPDEQELAHLEAGGVCGEMSFFCPGSHSATVRALRPTTAARLTLDGFAHFKGESSTAAFKMMLNIVSILSERLRMMDDRVCGMVAESHDERRHRDWQEFRSNLFATWTFG